MDSIDFRDRLILEDALANYYFINDPTGDSVFASFIPEVHENLNIRLSKPIIWNIDFGKVKIRYEIDRRGVGRRSATLSFVEYYLPEQLRTQYDLLGAIYTFYNDPLTEERIQELHTSTLTKSKLRELNLPNFLAFVKLDRRKVKKFDYDHGRRGYHVKLYD